MSDPKPKRSLIRAVAENLLAFAIAGPLILGLLAYCSDRDQDSASKAPAAPPAPAAAPTPTLSAEVQTVGPLLSVTNRDSFAWLGCTLTLNPHGFWGNGFDQEILALAAGKQAVLDLTEFAATDGQRFDPTSMKVLTIYLHCSTPKGEASFAGKWGPAPPE